MQIDNFNVIDTNELKQPYSTYVDYFYLGYFTFDKHKRIACELCGNSQKEISSLINKISPIIENIISKFNNSLVEENITIKLVSNYSNINIFYACYIIINDVTTYVDYKISYSDITNIIEAYIRKIKTHKTKDIDSYNLISFYEAFTSDATAIALLHDTSKVFKNTAIDKKLISFLNAIHENDEFHHITKLYLESLDKTKLFKIVDMIKVKRMNTFLRDVINCLIQQDLSNDDLRILFNHESISFRIAIARQYNVPKDILLEYQNDPNPEFKEYILSRLTYITAVETHITKNETIVFVKDNKSVEIKTYDLIIKPTYNLMRNTGWHLLSKPAFKNITLDDNSKINGVYEYDGSIEKPAQEHSISQTPMNSADVKKNCFYIDYKNMFIAVDKNNFLELISTSPVGELEILQEYGKISDLYSSMDVAVFNIHQGESFKLGYPFLVDKKPIIYIFKAAGAYKGICYEPVDEEDMESNKLCSMTIKDDNDVINFFSKILDALNDTVFRHRYTDIIHDIDKIYDAL